MPYVVVNKENDKQNMYFSFTDFFLCFVDKYKDHLDRIKKDRSHPKSSPNSSNGLATIDQSQQVPQGQSESSFLEKSWPSGHDLSRPSSSATLQNGMSTSSFPNSRSLSKYGQSTYQDSVRSEGPAKGRYSEAHQRPDLVPVTRKFRARKIFEFHLARWASNSQILLAWGTSPLAQVFKLNSIFAPNAAIFNPG